jgi:hypothetical protein
MRPRARFLLVSAALLAATALAVPNARSKGVTGPGCDPPRSAIAHRAGGVPLKPQPTGAPTPCMTFTGPTTDSAAIGVTETGTVFYGPIERQDPDPAARPRGRTR